MFFSNNKAILRTFEYSLAMRNPLIPILSFKVQPSVIFLKVTNVHITRNRQSPEFLVKKRKKKNLRLGQNVKMSFFFLRFRNARIFPDAISFPTLLTILKGQNKKKR